MLAQSKLLEISNLELQFCKNISLGKCVRFCCTIWLVVIDNGKCGQYNRPMPRPKRWSLFTISRLRFVPDVSGVYELGDAKGVIVYIGSGDSKHGVRGRLLFHKKDKPSSVRYFRFLETGIFQSPLALEEEHCDKFKAEYGRLPRLQRRMPKGYLFRW